MDVLQGTPDTDRQAKKAIFYFFFIYAARIIGINDVVYLCVCCLLALVKNATSLQKTMIVNSNSYVHCVQ